MMDMMVTWFEGEVLIGCLEVFKGNHLCVCVCVYKLCKAVKGCVNRTNVNLC